MNKFLKTLNIKHFQQTNSLMADCKKNFFSNDNKFFIFLNSKITNTEEIKIKFNFSKQIDENDLFISLYKRLGAKFINEISGGFVIIIVDTHKGVMMIFRDHFGILPCYYNYEDGQLIISSSINSIFRFKNERGQINNESVSNLILYMGIEKSETFFKDIQQIPKAHFINITKESFCCEEYYDLAKINENKFYSEDEYFEHFKYLFKKSVKNYLSVCSDSIGFSLSGGLDSSSIVCMANVENTKSEKKRILNSYSIILDGLKGEEAKKAFETNFINIVTDTTEIPNTKIKIKDTGPLSNLETYSCNFSQPIRSPNYFINMKIYEKLKERGVNCHFEGFDGDDIVSHGYERLKYLGSTFKLFTLFEEEKKLRNRRGLQFSLLNSIKSNVLGNLLPVSAFKSIKNKISNEKTHYSEWSEIVSSNVKKDIDFDNKLVSIWGKNPYEFNDHNSAHLFSVTNHNKEYGIEMLREMGEIYDVEIMLPFFDRELVEFCLNVPSELKLHDGYDRYIFRKSMDGIVPKEILERTTKGDISALTMKEMLNIDSKKLMMEIFDSKSFLSSFLDEKNFYLKVSEMSDRKNLKFITNIFQICSLNQWLNDNT